MLGKTRKVRKDGGRKSTCADFSGEGFFLAFGRLVSSVKRKSYSWKFKKKGCYHFNFDFGVTLNRTIIVSSRIDDIRLNFMETHTNCQSLIADKKILFGLAFSIGLVSNQQKKNDYGNGLVEESTLKHFFVFWVNWIDYKKYIFS